MEASEEPDRVRPLIPDPPAAGTGDGPDQPPVRRWLPVVVVAAALSPTGVAFDWESFRGMDFFTFTPDGRHVAALAWHPSRLTLTVTTEALEGSLHHLTSIDDVARPLGYTGDGRYLVVGDPTNRNLVFHDWEQDATYRVPFDSDDILAVYG